MAIIQIYRFPGLNSTHLLKKCNIVKSIDSDVTNIESEFCFNIEIKKELSVVDIERLKWILSDPLKPNSTVRNETTFHHSSDITIVEVGPRLNFSTPFSTNAVSICQSFGLTQIQRFEVSVRYKIHKSNSSPLSEQVKSALYDRMTECIYPHPVKSFDHGLKPEQWYYVDVLREGQAALRNVNIKLGLSFDEWDLKFYTERFTSVIKRNPTSVECFDLAQSNSEHCRHWFFKGKMIIDGEEKQHSLLQMIIDTQNFSNSNNIIKFSDNSSAINGFTIKDLIPEKSEQPSRFKLQTAETCLIFTAETHNFPTAVSPFSGATTGTGGRIRDVQAVGRGGYVIAATAGYSVGNLLIDDYEFPWENNKFCYPFNFAKPLDILIEASNGASDYGNKFGEPVIAGFVRSFGQTDASNQRREFIKPIMFSGGIGKLNAVYASKIKPKKGMKVVKLGGPVYRIGVGGGSASSTQCLFGTVLYIELPNSTVVVQPHYGFPCQEVEIDHKVVSSGEADEEPYVLIQGDNRSELDFGAVQRGDPEMEQKLNRVVRACLENMECNPILSIHDQGAGGNGNVLKEIIEPEGAIISTKAFKLGDSSINTLELWGAEYQESNAILCETSRLPLLNTICSRERCPIDVVGTVTGNKRIILTEDEIHDEYETRDFSEENTQNFPVNLDLELVLGNIPQKEFHLKSEPNVLKPLVWPANMSTMMALNRVLRLPSVASKRFLTNKVDRSVSGLIAQQQCVGPMHTPVADVAVTAISHYDKVGIASSIGEQPIIGLVHSAAGARMSVAESLSNLVFAPISSLSDIKCSGNWMWPAKLPGEGAKLYETCAAMCDIMKSVGIAVDGGKDSLSMATRLDDGTVVKSPGTLVISTYVPCVDITAIITPDIKSPSMCKQGVLLHVDISNGMARLGGSALAQCFKQLGEFPPDIDSPVVLKTAFNVTQKLIVEKKILSGHDISDGGLITCLLEMAFSGLSGIEIDLSYRESKVASYLDILFAEECGWILECSEDHWEYVQQQFSCNKVPCFLVGKTKFYGMNSEVLVKYRNSTILHCDLYNLYNIWEETSYYLERHQMNPLLAQEEYESLKGRKVTPYRYSSTLNLKMHLYDKSIKVAVIREEGTNGDREMIASLSMAGFEVWDVNMQDLLDQKITVDRFRGVVFPGGFSYADVLGSAKGWAANLIFNASLYKQLSAFYNRSDTFSLGVCNGCQLMALLGWININPPLGSVGYTQSHFNADIALKENDSGRFESRFSTVVICKSEAMMLRGMENSILGVWVAHAEGKVCFQDESIRSRIEENNCIPVKYVDDDGIPTEKYPFNPNGSPGGIAGICSQNGRHLAMMPHPERCIQFWQWPYIPPEWREHSGDLSPWFQMFVNAYEWCCSDIKA